MHISYDKTKNKRYLSESERGGRFICETGTDEHSRWAHKEKAANANTDATLSSDFYQPFMMFEHAGPGEIFH